MSSLEIETGARLHFGLLAVRALTGRQFGGCGLMVDGLGTRLRISPAGQDEFVAPPEWVQRVVRTLDAYRKNGDPNRPAPPVRIEVLDAVPQHVGLGSGTQLSLAIARGLAQLGGEPEQDAPALARRVGRGHRSAIGLHGFDLGGFLIEAGKHSEDEISPIAVRCEYPAEWRFVLVRPKGARGLSGAEERERFANLKPMPGATTDHLCRILLTDLLPALRSRSFDAFADSLFEYGQLVGEYFAKAQGGTFADISMRMLCPWLRDRGIHGIGQTSWGPTLFVACSSPDHAEAVVLRLAESDWRECVVTVVGPRNAGASVQ